MKFLFSIFIFAIIGCNAKHSIPSDVLPKEKMIAVLSDIHLAEASVQEGFTNDSAKRSISLYYQQIFNHHRITSTQFYHSFDYYTHNPEQMDSLYQNLINEMTRQQSELQRNFKKDTLL